ncbi:SRPBCC family protein [Kineobactrum salinum]|uniref:SRPBCC family protein n=1 Tax=Kineobactrum salinum TaxID=2708301 RepID=A0A6C0U369_9GAMM|nr:SRPBCC family protein [Kineobactrum salinum]QIB66466.1 SRPBCC family protein [Kineobactrum salinum]
MTDKTKAVVGAVQLERVIDAPADRVWTLLRWENVAALAAGGFFASAEYEGLPNRPGAIRRLVFEGAPPLVERLETFDESNMHYTYRILEPGPMPVVTYVGAVGVVSLGESRCRVVLEARFEPVRGVGVDDFRALYRQNNTLLLNFLAGRVDA